MRASVFPGGARPVRTIGDIEKPAKRINNLLVIINRNLPDNLLKPLIYYQNIHNNTLTIAKAGLFCKNIIYFRLCKAILKYKVAYSLSLFFFTQYF